MDFIQNLRVSALLERFNHWSQRDSRVAFFNNLPLPEDHGRKLRALDNIYIVAPWNDGYEEFFGTRLKYHELTTGKVFILRPYDNANLDYTCYQQLYQASQLLNTFRINQPVFREVVTIGEGQFEYIEIISPTNEAGGNASSRFLASMSFSSQFFIDYVNESLDMLRSIKTISENNHVGFPETTCTILDRYTDTQGYFYGEVLDWNSTYELFVDQNLEFLSGAAKVLVLSGSMTQGEYDSFIAYARTQWTQL
jgi:hypothetical protein